MTRTFLVAIEVPAGQLVDPTEATEMEDDLVTAGWPVVEVKLWDSPSETLAFDPSTPPTLL